MRWLFYQDTLLCVMRSVVKWDSLVANSGKRLAKYSRIQLSTLHTTSWHCRVLNTAHYYTTKYYVMLINYIACMHEWQRCWHDPRKRVVHNTVSMLTRRTKLQFSYIFSYVMPSLNGTRFIVEVPSTRRSHIPNLKKISSTIPEYEQSSFRKNFFICFFSSFSFRILYINHCNSQTHSLVWLFKIFPGVTSTPCQPPLALDVKMLANY